MHRSYDDPLRFNQTTTNASGLPVVLVMITTSSSKDAQLVSSWIHHEEQNVTIARIALFTSQRNNASSSRDGASSSSSSVSRSRASELLREVVSTDPDVVYRATWCDQTDGQQVDGVPCTGTCAPAKQAFLAPGALFLG